jgi:4-cresol dehydrogenase (hydroxylating) flavoprotein subunit
LTKAVPQTLAVESGSLSAAVREWRSALGDDFVISEGVPLDRAETATFRTQQKIPLILRPRSREHVSEMMRVAAHHGVPVYPVSSGKNWGYGSRVPVVSGCVLADLSAMKQIVDFNERLGYVTVQPGVTQQDLYDFLGAQKSRLWMDATGSSPQCSLIGNAMERGFGHTPYGDHFAQVSALEVVLANGEVIRTGFAGLPGSQAGKIYRWGAGPSLDGLFSQSNLGIVTEMTVWLMPAPEYFQAFFFQSDREDGLAAIVEALRPLRMDGTLRSAIHIANDYKVLAGLQQFPAGETAPLRPERMAELRRELKFTRWSGSGGLYGTRAQVAEARRLLKDALRDAASKLQFLDDRTLRIAARFTGIYGIVTGLDLKRTLELVKPVYGLLRGVPTQQPLGSAYWRKSIPVPNDPDPDRDGCGLIWIAPVAPMEGGHAMRLAGIVEHRLLADGFEPMISVTLLTERSISCVVSLTYDREKPGEDEKAMECYLALQTELEREGYYSYRRATPAFAAPGADDAYGRLLKTIRTALDPADVLAPGRYVPRV